MDSLDVSGFFQTPMDVKNPGNGAVEENNLETAPAFSILQELEEWGNHLKSLPEVTHTLREFETAARGAVDDAEDGEPPPPGSVRHPRPRRSGPSL